MDDVVPVTLEKVLVTPFALEPLVVTDKPVVVIDEAAMFFVPFAEPEVSAQPTTDPLLTKKLEPTSRVERPEMFGNADALPGMVQRIITTPFAPAPGVPSPVGATESEKPDPPPPLPVFCVPAVAAVFPRDPAPPAVVPLHAPPAPGDPVLERSFPPPPPAA